SGTHFLSTYDAAGRLTGLSRAALPLPLTMLSKAYDAQGRLTTEQEFDEATGLTMIHRRQLTYGGLNGRLSNESHTYQDWVDSAPTMSYTYDPFGQLQTIVYPEGPIGRGGAFSLLYTYQNGYVVSAYDPNSPSTALATVAYNAAGGVQEVRTSGF